MAPPAEIERALRGAAPEAMAVEAYAEIGSTQDRAFELASSAVGAGPVACVAALAQTAGRGTRGKAWFSVSDALAMSVAFADDPDPAQAAERAGAGVDQAIARASVAAGVAAHEAAERFVGPGRLALRWPNDLLCEGRKLAGVLIERRGGVTVVGVGVNLDHRGDWPEEVAARATTLAGCGGRAEAQAFAPALLASLLQWQEEPRETLSLAWTERERSAGTRGAFVVENARYEGRVLSIDPFDCILLERDDGSRVRLPTARAVRG
ncbi:MAG: biotin--[acetyl-CoA-carboxylase] ligase [Phycisphaerales bacterium]|nr:MAG: biotin--[acetyl-CoA-carboxylase] ligase [Phycisphaerales bacterium]